MALTLVKLPQLLEIVQLSRSSVYDAIKSGDFPPPVKIGKRAVAWRMQDVEAWLQSREYVREIEP